MPVKNYLKTDEKQKLQNELKYNEHPDIRERILILLLQNDSKTQQEIADFVGCSLRKIAHLCVHADANNLEILKDKRMEGNYQKATPEYVNKLMEVIEKDPEELGYEFGRWTAQRLATYLGSAE
jgi:hypothetical protein